MDQVFLALGHRIRRVILDRLRHTPGLSVGELASGFDVTRIAVMNHLAVLEKAGLIVSEKEGRVRRLYLNAVPIQMIYDRWLSGYASAFATKVTAIKYAAETAAMEE